MFGLIPEILQYWSFREVGFPRKLPLSLTFNLTNRCNCRCKTCGIYNSQSRELSQEEIIKILQSFGGNVPWLTFSGGELFLRDDFDVLCIAAHDLLKPKIINIPTNATLPHAVCDKIEKVLRACRHSRIILNMSLDGIGSKHDEIRGLKGSFDSLLESYRKLRGLKYKNFHIGINTILSKHNAGDFLSLVHEVNEIAPDSHFIEYAQCRFELKNKGMDFEADKAEYFRCIDEINAAQSAHKDLLTKVIKALRHRYYKLTKKILSENRRALPCFAGFSNAHISSEGDVWACGIKGDIFGSLREENYDFKRIWFGEKAGRLRERLKHADCFCVGSNITFQNMLFDMRQLNGFFFEFLKELLK
jgi:MoaA/NifB/PqqE/SkfB family radical SAM enzyme